MSESNDPVRLLDDPGTPSELRSLLMAARGDVIDRAAVARVQARVHDGRAAPPMGRRWWVIGGGVALVVGWLALRPADSPSVDAPRELASASVRASAVVTEPPRRDDLPAPVVSTPVVDAAPAVAATPSRARARPAFVRPPAPVATPSAPSTSEEARLLLAARRSLAHDPAAALARTQEHERRFGSGALVEERELVAVRALVALDRRAEARARADAFAERFPGSVHGSALARALE